MKKAEWGTKRICLNCEKPFYDLLKNPDVEKDEIKCPECGKSWKLADFLLLQAANLEKTKRGVHKVKDDLDDFADDDVLIDPSTDNSLMEDTSDLGDDNLDMAEVTDNASAGEKGDE